MGRKRKIVRRESNGREQRASRQDGATPSWVSPWTSRTAGGCLKARGAPSGQRAPSVASTSLGSSPNPSGWAGSGSGASCANSTLCWQRR